MEGLTRGQDEHGLLVLAFEGANAPDDASEDEAYARVLAWRAFDRDPLAFVRLASGRKRAVIPVE